MKGERATDVEIAAAIASAAAHDVRNLLAVAETSAHLAADNLDDRAFATKHLDKVRVKLRQAQELIGRCLAVASGDAIDASPTAVETVLRDVLGMVAVPEGVALEITDADPPLTVACEPLLLARAIANLVENAVHAVAAVESGRVWVDAREEPGSIVVSVSDNGPGIDPAQVFSGKTTKIGGSGLGLRISRAIVSAHRGTLDLVAPQTSGTTFELRLPR